MRRVSRAITASEHAVDAGEQQASFVAARARARAKKSLSAATSITGGARLG